MKTELAKPASVGLTDQEAADLLNTPGPPVPGAIQAGKLLIWAAATGTRGKVEAAITDPATPAAVVSACLAVRDMVSGGAAQLDVSHPMISGAGGLLDGLTAAGVLPASGPGSKADLIAFGSAPGPSVAQTVFGVPVSAHDVNHARGLG